MAGYDIIDLRMTMKSNKKKGFTLIELMVVISIISFLSSIVFVSLSNAQSKGRDARRISDFRQLLNALELYRNDHGGYYPISLFSLLGPPKYISKVPTPPPYPGGAGQDCAASYCYAYFPSNNPDLYHLGIKLENSGGVLNSDSDFSSSSVYAEGFDGGDANGRRIYDIKN